MQALERKVVRVIGGFPGGARPVQQRGAQALADFLLLLIEPLLRHFLPRETQVAHHRHEAQPDGFAGREEQGMLLKRPFVAKIF